MHLESENTAWARSGYTNLAEGCLLSVYVLPLSSRAVLELKSSYWNEALFYHLYYRVKKRNEHNTPSNIEEHKHNMTANIGFWILYIILYYPYWIIIIHDTIAQGERAQKLQRRLHNKRWIQNIKSGDNTYARANCRRGCLQFLSAYSSTLLFFIPALGVKFYFLP